MRHYLIHTTWPELKQQMFGSDVPEEPSSIAFSDSLGVLNELLRLELTIDDSTWSLLETAVEQRLNAPVVIQDSPNTWYTASLHHDDQEYNIKIRLRGDTQDNYFFGAENATYRINLPKGETLQGYRKFSLIRPFHENGAFGFYYYRYLEEQGLLANDIQFVQLTINGEAAGFWFLQEGFAEHLYSSAGKQGVLFKFENDCMERNGATNPSGLPRLNPYEEGRYRTDTSWLKHYQHPQEQLLQLQQGTIGTAEVFDLKQWAKFAALNDLFFGHHSMACHNSRIFYNLETERLEPVAWDPKAFQFLPYDLPDTYLTYYVNSGENPLYELLAQDTTFVRLYLNELQQALTSNELLDYVSLHSDWGVYINDYGDEPRTTPNYQWSYFQQNIDKLSAQFNIADPLYLQVSRKDQRAVIYNKSFLPFYCEALVFPESGREVKVNQVVYYRLMVPLDSIPEQQVELKYRLLNEVESRITKEVVRNGNVTAL